MVENFEYEIPFTLFDVPLHDEEGNMVMQKLQKKYFSKTKIDYIIKGTHEISSKKDTRILTIEEIDQLLDAINLRSRRKIQNYDFSDADFFTKEQIEDIDFAIENFRKFFATNVSCLIKKTVELYSSIAYKMSYTEMIQETSKDTVLFEFHSGRNRYFFMNIPNILVYELLCSEIKENPCKENDCKNFFQNCGKENLEILKKIANREITPLLNKLFFNYAGLKFKCTKVETNYKKLQFSPCDERGTILKMECYVAGTEYLFSIWFPKESLEDKIDCFILKERRSQKFMEAKKMEDNIVKKIDDVQVNVKAVLGQTVISLKDIKRLKRGTVLKLDGKHYCTAEIEINGAKVAEGDVVSIDHRKFGVKVEKIYKPNKQKRSCDVAKK